MSTWARRVVVTGIGLITPLGSGVANVWPRLVAGDRGVARITRFDTSGLPVSIAGQVPTGTGPGEFDVDALVSPKEQRRLEWFILYALAAADEALGQAAWRPAPGEAARRSATVIASGVGGFPAITDAARQLVPGERPRVSPFLIPSFLANLAAGQVSIRHGLQGALHTPVTACAAGAQAIAEAAKLIRLDEADVVVAGGAEACIDPLSIAGFAAARALSAGFEHDPAAASRPFDTARDGFVMAEGAAILVLEEREHALRRGAAILAELVGYGCTADAYHVTAPPANGEGAARAMQAALGAVAPAQVGHIAAHATSTPAGDLAELNAIRAVFHANGGRPAISAPKASTGHLLGAAGALAAAVSVLALKSGQLPPIANLETPDPAAEGLDLIRDQARQVEIDYSLCNGFGFGGVNASLLFKRHHG